MILKSIKLTNFKNYEQIELQFCDGINCLVGKNGMGKTNLLDAVYLSCMTKNYFGLNDKQLIFHENDFFRVESNFEEKESAQTVVAKYQKGKKKEMALNGKTYDKFSEHIGRFPIVMISPDDIKVILEGSEVRRKFLDNVLSQEDSIYLHNLLDYNRVLKQRNAALKGMKDRGGPDESLLQTYDKQLIGPAELIHQKRKDFLTDFVPVLKAMYLMISGGNEKVDCKYKSSLTEQSLEAALIESRMKDFYLQYTSKGIHRDDLIFEFEERALKKFASQGQRKTFLLALKLAQFEFLRRKKGSTPILLLDDIFDKLDKSRVNKLVELLTQESFGQVFITDTDEIRLAALVEKTELNFLRFTIKEGKAYQEHEA